MAGGPVTKETSALSLGLAQIRVGNSATNIAKAFPALVADDSIGSLAETVFRGNTEWWTHESGFPLKTDYKIPIRESAEMECQFEELTPYNIALANGIDPTSGENDYSNAHSGEIALGGKTAPDYVRMEAIYTYPNGTNHMYILFPRAQVTSSIELGFAKEDNAKPSIVFSSNLADSNVTGGNAAWDGKPLGVIMFD